MPTITELLSADHARCDDLFASAEALVSRRQWPAAKDRFGEFTEAMEHHFTMEEGLFFPEFERRTGQTAGPTRVMRMEHTQMRELMDEMGQSLVSEDLDAYLGQSETLLVIMQQHNLKEQQMLYPMVDQVLGEDAAELVRGMQAL